MWFQTLKTRQSVRCFSTSNSQGHVAGLEYTDKKSEVHALKVGISTSSTSFYRGLSRENLEDLLVQGLTLTLSLVSLLKCREKYRRYHWKKE